MTDRTVSVGLDANISGYLAKMAAAGLSTKGLGSALSDVNDKILHGETSTKKLGAAFDGVVSGTTAVAAGAVVAAVAILKFTEDGVKAYVHLADEVRAYSRVSGESAQDSSRMVAALSAVGIQSDVGATAMFRLSQNIEKHGATLAADGIQVVRSAGGNVKLTDTLLSISDAYKNTVDPAQRNKLVMDAFGRSGINLIPILAEGRARIQEFWAAAEKHGQILDDSDLQRARQLQLAMHDLGQSWSGLQIQLGKTAIPATTWAVHEFTKVVEGWAIEGDHMGSILGTLTHLHFHHASAAQQDAAAIANMKQQMDDATKSASDFGTELDSLVKLTFGVADGQDQFTRDLISWMGAVKTAATIGDAYAHSLDAANETGLANRKMLQGLVQDILNTAKAARDAAAQQGMSASLQEVAVTQATAGQRIQLASIVKQLGINQDAADTYLSVLDVLGSTKVTSTVTLEDKQAFANLDAFYKATQMIPKTIASQLVLDVRLVEEFKGTPNSIASPALLAARGRQAAATAPPISLPTAAPTPSPSPSTKDVKAFDDYLKALFEQRMQIIKNEFHEGRATLAEYEHSLDEQLAREKPWTDKWVALQQEKADAVHYWTDAVAKYLEAFAAKQASIEDNEYAAGVLGKDRYLEILQQRLAGLEKYSDAWMQVWREIQQIEGNALDAQIKLIQAYDQGRQFQSAFDAAARSRNLGWGQLSPVAPSPTVVVQGGSSYSPSWQISGVADPVVAASTSMQQNRDYAALVGV